MIQTATPPTIHELQRRIAYLEEVNAVQKKVIQRFYRLLPVENKKFAPGEKLAWAAAKPLIDNEKPNEQGLVRLPIDKVAEQIGMSESSASRYLMNICERFEATHDVEPYTTKKGQKCNLTYIDPTDPLWTTYPDELPLPPEKERTINGNGKQCPRCHTDNLKITPRRIKYQEIQECECCGYKKVSGILDDNEPLPPSEYIPPKLDKIEEAEKGPQAGEPFENASDTDGQKAFQAGEPFESDEKALTSAPAYDPVTPPIVAEISPAAVEVEGCNKLLQLPAVKMTPGAYPLNGFSLEDLLSRRIGPGQIIVSTGKLDQAAKYISKPADYTPNIAAYLRGDLAHIYGSRPAFPDGTTWLLGFDCDAPELDGGHLAWMELVAAAGIPSVYWKRRPGRGHLEVYVDHPVDRKAFYAHLVSVCPGLMAVPEVFPIGSDQNTGGVDRADFGYSWPLYYRMGNQVLECAAEVMFPGDQVPMLSTGIESDRERLTWLLSQALTPAACIPERIVTQASDEAMKPGGALLDTRLPKYSSSSSDGLGKAVIAEFNDVHTWEEIAALCGGLHRDRFCSPAHKEDTPSVVIRGNYASDFGRTPSGRVETRDKFGWWCLARGINQDEELKRLIAERQVLA